MSVTFLGGGRSSFGLLAGELGVIVRHFVWNSPPSLFAAARHVAVKGAFVLWRS